MSVEETSRSPWFYMAVAVALLLVCTLLGYDYSLGRRVATIERSLNQNGATTATLESILLESEGAQLADISRNGQALALESARLNRKMDAASQDELALDDWVTQETISDETQLAALSSRVAALHLEATAAAEDVGQLRINGSGLRQDLVVAEQSASDTTAALGALTKPATASELVASYAPATPVYNVIFDMPLRAGEVHLYPDKETALRFYVGSPSLLNALLSPEQTVSSKLLNQKGNIPLDVSFLCDACSSGGHQSKSIVYLSDQMRSTEAEFSFTPDSKTAAADHGKLSATLVVEGSGLIYNQIPLTMYVDMPTPAAPLAAATPPIKPSKDEATKSTAQTGGAASQAPPGTSAGGAAPPPALNRLVAVPPPTDHAAVVGAFSLPDRGSRPADLIITIDRQPDGYLAIQIKPRSPALASYLGPLYQDQRGEARWFSQSSLSPGQLQSEAAKAALLIRSVVDSKNAALEHIRQNSLKDSESSAPDSVEDLSLDNSSRDAILEALLGRGTYVYDKLFNRQSPDLATLMEKIESFTSPEARSLRILILQGQISFPSQLLHKAGGDLAWGFWGFQYELVVDYTKRDYPGRLDRTVTPTNNAVSIFGTYQAGVDESTDSQSVASRGQQELDYFRQRFTLARCETPHSRKDFLAALTSNADSVDYVLVYAHGSSGAIVRGTPEGDVVVEREAEGPRLLFDSSGVYVTPEDIDTLPIGKSRLVPYLNRKPIVILNACDTGTVTILPDAENITFPQALLDVGASGVIATESPVWNGFAYQFEKDLIERMGTSTPLSLSLLETRRKYLTIGNPMGLLYSYYGGVTVDRASDQ